MDRKKSNSLISFLKNKTKQELTCEGDEKAEMKKRAFLQSMGESFEWDKFFFFF